MPEFLPASPATAKVSSSANSSGEQRNVQESNLPPLVGVHRAADGLAPTSQMTFQTAESGGHDPQPLAGPRRLPSGPPTIRRSLSMRKAEDSNPTPVRRTLVSSEVWLHRQVTFQMRAQMTVMRTPVSRQSAAGPAIGRRSQQSGRQGLNLRSLASDASAIPLRYTLMNQYPVRESNPPLRLERSTASPEARTGLQYRVRVSNPSGWVENPATSRKSNAARVRSTSGSNRADRCCRAAPSP